MKTGNAHWFKLILLTAMLMLATRSQAYYTNYLDSVTNALTEFRATLTNDTPAERRQIALIDRALRTLAKPSDSVAGDYNLFVTAATQLGPLATDTNFVALGEGVFNAFTNEAQAQIIATQDRIAALSDFVRTKKAASNNIRQAQETLDRIPTLDDARFGLLLGRQVFKKITTANRIAAKGEAKPGFALDSVVGTSLTHTNRSGDSGTITFIDATNFTSDSGGGTYTYTRTGLNTATLVGTEDGGTPDEGVTTVKLVFTATGQGKFTARFVSSDETENSSGTFTISD